LQGDARDERFISSHSRSVCASAHGTVLCFALIVSDSFVSTGRFLAYLARACWLVLAPITLWTGQQWPEQRMRAAQGFHFAETWRQEFSREVAAWGVITLAASTPLAEHRQHFQHHLAQALERPPHRVADRLSEHISHRS
jgi:hypothetical protein